VSPSLKPRHIALALLVMVVWGFNFAASKIGLEQLPPMLLVGLRFALVALLLAPFARLPRGRWGRLIALSFTLGLLHFPLMFLGLRDIDAATAAITVQLQVPFAALIAGFVLKDTFGWRRTAGLAIAVAGVAVIAGEPRLEGRTLALAMIVVACLVWAVANIQIKLLGDIDGITLNAWLAILATPQLALASLVFERGQLEALAAADWRAAFSVAYQAVAVVVVGYGIWFRLLRSYQVNQTMPFTLLVPLFGVLSGVLVLGEPLTSWILAGGALTVAGVAIIVLRPAYAGRGPAAARQGPPVAGRRQSERT